MAQQPQPGLTGYAEKIVGSNDTALAHGSGTIAVFATPAMVALMEMAAWKSVQDSLPKGFISLGTQVSVKHIKATAPGKKVRAEATLTLVEGKKLVFDIAASDEDGPIGMGTHTRFVVEEAPFMEQLNK